MAQPGQHNLYIRRGADFIFTFDIDVSDTVLDLTGAAVFSQVRKYRNRESDKVADLHTSVTDGDATGYPSDINLTLSEDETAALEEGTYFYDVLVRNAAGNDTYYLEGKVVISDSVTVI